MIFLRLVIILLFILIFFYLRNFFKLNRIRKVFKPKNLTTFNRKNLNNWMNLTKQERYDLSKQESITYLDKRKLLLAAIRKEYKKISKVNSEKNTMEK